MDRTKQAAVDAKPERIAPMECPECGGTWFAEETVNPVRTGWNGELSQIGLMPLAELICLCGAPQRPPLGGTRSGRIANYSISGLMDSVAKAREEVKRRHEIAPIDDAAYKSLAKKGRLQGLQRDRNLVARRLGELLRRPGQKGANWRPPQREPASQGRDWLALELQARGCTFDEARSLVEAIFASIEAALKRGETVETPLGTFRVEVTEPFLRRRSGHFEWIRRGRKRRVAFKGVAIGPGAPEGGSV